jgi:hypothetical protein
VAVSVGGLACEYGLGVATAAVAVAERGVGTQSTSWVPALLVLAVYSHLAELSTSVTRCWVWHSERLATVYESKACVVPQAIESRLRSLCDARCNA